MLSPLLDFSRSDPKKGTLFDTRDGQSYPVIRINNQIWLAENFRYLPSKEKGDPYDTSCVYNNDNSYLDKGYGRLYDYDTANHIAPEGWKLPSNEDFIELVNFIKKDNNIFSSEVGNYLKSIDCWYPCLGITNNDKYGFNAKPTGNIGEGEYVGNFSDIITYFWCSNNSRVPTDSWTLYCSMGDFVNHQHYQLSYYYSVRLLKK